ASWYAGRGAQGDDLNRVPPPGSRAEAKVGARRGGNRVIGQAPPDRAEPALVSRADVITKAAHGQLLLLRRPARQGAIRGGSTRPDFPCQLAPRAAMRTPYRGLCPIHLGNVGRTEGGNLCVEVAQQQRWQSWLWLWGS